MKPEEMLKEVLAKTKVREPFRELLATGRCKAPKELLSAYVVLNTKGPREVFDFIPREAVEVMKEKGLLGEGCEGAAEDVVRNAVTATMMIMQDLGVIEVHRDGGPHTESEEEEGLPLCGCAAPKRSVH